MESGGHRDHCVGKDMMRSGESRMCISEAELRGSSVGLNERKREAEGSCPHARDVGTFWHQDVLGCSLSPQTMR